MLRALNALGPFIVTQVTFTISMKLPRILQTLKGFFLENVVRFVVVERNPRYDGKSYRIHDNNLINFNF